MDLARELIDNNSKGTIKKPDKSDKSETKKVSQENSEELLENNPEDKTEDKEIVKDKSEDKEIVKDKKEDKSVKDKIEKSEEADHGLVHKNKFSFNENKLLNNEKRD